MKYGNFRSRLVVGSSAKYSRALKIKSRPFSSGVKVIDCGSNMSPRNTYYKGKLDEWKGLTDLDIQHSKWLLQTFLLRLFKSIPYDMS